MAEARSTVVGVVGSAGGVGASSFACALTLALRAGLLVDLDSCGGGLDTMLGIEGVQGARWSDLQIAGGVLDPVDLARGLPHWRGTAVLAADGAVLPSTAVTTVLDAGRALGPVVVDAGRCVCADSVEVLRQCDAVVVLAEAEPRAVAGLRALAARLRPLSLAVVLRRGSLPRSEVQALTELEIVGVLAPLGRRSTMRMSRGLHRVAGGVALGLRTSPPVAAGLRDE